MNKYAYWCSSTDTINQTIVDFREHEEMETLSALGYSSEGDNLLKDGNVVGVIQRGLQKWLNLGIPDDNPIP